MTPARDQALSAADDFLGDPWVTPDAMVLQHGYCRNHRFWQAWLPYLGPEHRVLRPDLPGCGRSEAIDPSGLGLPDLAQMLARTLEQQNTGPVHYVGESLGGMIGVYLAATRPDLVRSLTLISTPLVVDDVILSTHRLDSTSWSAAVEELGLRAWWPETRRRMRPHGHPNDDDAARDAWVTAEVCRASDTTGAALARIIETVDLREHAPLIRQPTLLLVPDGSRYANRPEQLGLYSEIADCTVKVIPDGRHEMYVEQAHVLAPIVAEFVRSLVRFTS